MSYRVVVVLMWKYNQSFENMSPAFGGRFDVVRNKEGTGAEDVVGSIACRVLDSLRAERSTSSIHPGRIVRGMASCGEGCAALERVNIDQGRCYDPDV